MNGNPTGMTPAKSAALALGQLISRVAQAAPVGNESIEHQCDS
jgi:hypothetical protein